MIPHYYSLLHAFPIGTSIQFFLALEKISGCNVIMGCPLAKEVIYYAS